ncbi:amidohydrolase family protein [Aestuariirhabdus litorea]|uniref:Aminoacylase n=1 Tax=Aestuariirhabdus litorea TaxID=2528527 RepID=A0A3P3VIB3_9GAMM|nr:amidohydrolase family protein [Aestuariirhabdus litorea]RRJ82402.1 aminoacylase [Aestuariirhabdus litorea]RWW92565.1 aminoacylase [Endozoicomonadaceae bacterium GTF-13]
MKVTNRRLSGALGMALCLTVAPLMASDYDMVIENGRVMDPETMLDAVLNIGVKDGRIVKITPSKLEGSTTIDATGQVVAPGFIDTHFHSLDGLAVKLGALDGVTTGMDLEVGAIGIADWYESKKGKWPLNYGTGISHEGARLQVLDPEVKIDVPQDAIGIIGALRNAAAKDGVSGWSVSKADPEQMNQILKILDEGFKEGALNLASTTAYMRNGLTSFEMYQSMKVAANWGRFTSSHTRFHANPVNPEAQLGFDEVFTNAMVLGSPLLIAHNNDYGWWEIEEKLKLARERGLNMWSEYYPYGAAATAIGSSFLVPESVEGVFGYKYEDIMYDPQQDKFLTKDEYLALAKEEPGHLVTVFSPPRKDWMKSWLRVPHMTVAADSLSSELGLDSWDVAPTEYKGHPRTAGTRGRVLRMAREEGVPLMFTLSQMSYWPAMHLGQAGVQAMDERGRLQEGMVADITIFDPENVTDNATYKRGEQGLPTTGISYVIVNGQAVVENGTFKKVWAGQPIRFEADEEGRFQGLDHSEFLKNITIPAFTVDESGHGHDFGH